MSNFFKKITGIDWEDKKDNKKEEEDEQEQKQIETEEISPEKIKNNNIIKKNIFMKKEDKITLTKPLEKDDWLSESEGQLTIDVYQTPSDIIIKSTIAGVKPEDIDITMNNDMITIKGKRQKDEEIKEDDYYYQECYWGSFSRSVILPVDVEVERAEASLKNGILTIRLPKAEKAKSKKIQIKAE